MEMMFRKVLVRTLRDRRDNTSEGLLVVEAMKMQNEINPLARGTSPDYKSCLQIGEGVTVAAEEALLVVE